MYAIVEDGGRQYRVEKGQTLRVDARPAEAGKKVTFDRVLLVGDEKGVRIGKPVLKGAKVTAEVVAASRGPKLEVVQVRRRKASRRHIGHRQRHLEVRVTAIEE
jgi:large subunit ribosomal protein L21